MKNGSRLDILFLCGLVVWPLTSRPSVPHRATQCGYAHLPAAKDQPLLLWGDTRYFFDLLLDSSDLGAGGGLQKVSRHAPDIERSRRTTYLVFWIDIQLYL